MPLCIIIFPALVFARGLRKATSSVVVAPDSAYTLTYLFLVVSSFSSILFKIESPTIITLLRLHLLELFSN